jgi:hypothetical protein
MTVDGKVVATHEGATGTSLIETWSRWGRGAGGRAIRRKPRCP